MKRCLLVSSGIALLIGSCSLSAVTPSPMPSTQAPPTPTPDSALLFDGQDDYVQVADSSSLDLQTSFTISAWIYLEQYTEWASLVTKGDKPNTNNYAIQQSGPADPIYRTEFGRLRFSGCADLSAPLPESLTTIPVGRWHFVTVTFDGLQLTFYLNGSQDGSFDVRGPLCTNDQPLYIGVDLPLSSEYWQGAIDELRIWSAALSETQLQEVMHRNQTPRNGELVGYWPSMRVPVLLRMIVRVMGTMERSWAIPSGSARVRRSNSPLWQSNAGLWPAGYKRNCHAGSVTYL